MIFEDDVTKFLQSHPEYVKTLERAIWQEELNQSNQNYYGWEWHDVGTMGSKLVRLVTNDLAEINFKSNRTTLYFLANREVTKKAVEKFKAKQMELQFKIDVNDILGQVKKGRKKG
ncbi:MAG: hypothetical protein ACREBU_23725 [Nitrososphaera sp.]